MPKFQIKLADKLKSLKIILEAETYLIWRKKYGTLRMGHYLIVAHTTHLPWAKKISFDTSIGKDIR